MVPNDRRVTNATVDRILLVKEMLVAPSIEAQDLVVRGTALFQNIATIDNAQTLTVNTLTTSKVFASNFTDQLVLGTSNTITLNAPTPSTSLVYTLPDVGTNATFVMTEGAQTIQGVKTFVDTPVFLNAFALLTLTLSAVSNQLTLGSVETITLSAPTPTVSHTYTIPDVSVDSDFVMTEGHQLIMGVKAFVNMAIFISGFATASLSVSSVANQITMGVGNKITLNAPTPVADRIYTFPDVGADASFVMTEGAQTLNGVKTFTSAAVFMAGLSIMTLTLPAVANQLILGAGETITLNAPTPVASRIYTLPDVSANASFVMTEGAQTINGVKTFISAPVFPTLSLTNILLTNVTNQITLGTGNFITLTAPTPAASRTYTIPDVLTHATFLLSEGTQTINGSKLFSVAIQGTAAANQIVLNTGTTITLNAPAPVANRIYSFVDVGANANFVMTEGTQTINNTKTFTSAIVAAPLINQLVLGAVTTITINALAPAASRIYTMPDVLSNAQFLLSEGAQTINGSKTFAVAIRDTAVTNQIILGNVTTTTLNASAPAASRVYTIPDVLANASFVMTEGTQTINGIKTFTNAPVFPALSLTNITLTNVTNQIAMGTGQTITVNAPTPAASRVYTMPDVLANANFIMSEGNQTIAANKTFSGNILLATTGGTPANLNYYSETTQTPFALTGPFSVSPQNTTVRYVRIGINVTMIFTGFTVVPGGVASPIVSTTLVPAEYRPVETFQEFVSVTNSGAASVGNLEVNTSGVLTFWRVQNFNATQVTLQSGGASVGVISFAKSWRTT